MIGTTIARVGFEILQPVSVIQEEIAKDPTSPIAVGMLGFGIIDAGRPA